MQPDQPNQQPPTSPAQPPVGPPQPGAGGFQPGPQPTPDGGAPIPPYGTPDAGPQPGGSKKWLPIVIIVGAIILVVGGYFAWKAMQGSDTSEQNGSADQAAETASYSDIAETEALKNGVLTLSPTFNAAESIKSQTLSASVGEQVNASDGMSFAVSKVERNWASPTGVKPLSGYEFVAVTVVYGNRDNSRTKTIPGSTFRLYDSADEAQGTSLEMPTTQEGNFEATPIAAGEQRTGTLVYEVKQDTTPLTLVYDEEYVSSVSGNVTIEVRVGL